MLLQRLVSDDSHSVPHHDDHIIQQGHETLIDLLLVGSEHLHLEVHRGIKYTLLTSLLLHLIQQHVHGHEVGLHQRLNRHIIHQPNEVLQTVLILRSQTQQISVLFSLLTHLIHWFLFHLLPKTCLH